MDNTNAVPRLPHPIDAQALADAVEIVRRLQSDHDADIRVAAICVAEVFGWTLGQTAHLMAHLAFTEASARHELAKADHRMVFRSRLAAIHARIEEALAGTRRVDFGAFRVELIPLVGQVPEDNLDKVAVWGAVAFRWGSDFLSEVVESPSWLDVAVIANGAVEESGVEDMSLTGIEDTGRVNGDGAPIYRLLMKE